MDRLADKDETSRLLSELDSAIDHSSMLRDIVNCRERLRDLERITGPSRKTRSLRRQIELLESRLALARSNRDLLAFSR